MTDLLKFSLPLTAGFVMGIVYQAGLWWSVRSIPSRTRPVAFAVSSFFVRLACVLIVFYFVMDSFLAGPLFLAGFLAVRYGVTRYVRST